jgi:hypothetical protein
MPALPWKTIATPDGNSDRLLALGKANREAVLDGLGLEGRSLAGRLHARLPAPRDHVEPSAGHEGNDLRPLDRERIRHTGPVGGRPSTPRDRRRFLAGVLGTHTL